MRPPQLATQGEPGRNRAAQGAAHRVPDQQPPAHREDARDRAGKPQGQGGARAGEEDAVDGRGRERQAAPDHRRSQVRNGEVLGEEQGSALREDCAAFGEGQGDLPAEGGEPVGVEAVPEREGEAAEEAGEEHAGTGIHLQVVLVAAEGTRLAQGPHQLAPRGRGQQVEGSDR